MEIAPMEPAVTLRPEAVVSAYLDAYAARDFGQARRYLSDHSFTYRGPLSTFTSADAFIADVSRIGAILERIERRKTFVDGNDVCSILTYKVRMDRLMVAPVVQLATVVDGKIVAMEAFFDASEYQRLFNIDAPATG